LRRRDAAHKAILYAFRRYIEHDGEDMRDRAFLDRKAALARLLRATDAGILLNEHDPEGAAGEERVWKSMSPRQRTAPAAEDERLREGSMKGAFEGQPFKLL